MNASKIFCAHWENPVESVFGLYNSLFYAYKLTYCVNHLYMCLVFDL